jgi:hypothetical protein
MLIKFLQDNGDIFATKPADMAGIPRNLIEHKVNVKPGAKPIK